MKIEGRFIFPASSQEVWDLLTDPQSLQHCTPGCKQLTEIATDEFEATMEVGIGPIKGTFNMSVEFIDLRAPEHAEVLARGQAPGSAVEMRNTMDLVAAGERTTLRWASDVTVNGMIAQVGARLMQGAADKITQQVFSCIKAKLEAPVTA